MSSSAFFHRFSVDVWVSLTWDHDETQKRRVSLQRAMIRCHTQGARLQDQKNLMPRQDSTDQTDWAGGRTPDTITRIEI